MQACKLDEMSKITEDIERKQIVKLTNIIKTTDKATLIKLITEKISRIISHEYNKP